MKLFHGDTIDSAASGCRHNHKTGDREMKNAENNHKQETEMKKADNYAQMMDQSQKYGDIYYSALAVTPDGEVICHSKWREHGGDAENFWHVDMPVDVDGETVLVPVAPGLPSVIAAQIQLGRLSLADHGDRNHAVRWWAAQTSDIVEDDAGIEPPDYPYDILKLEGLEWTVAWSWRPEK